METTTTDPSVRETNREEVMNLMMKRMKDKIKDKKYKMTSQRQVILRAFVDSNIRHMSAEEVFERVKKVAPDIGLATVYRTLDLFTTMDLLKKLDFDDGCSRYELNDHEDEGHFHHHLICLGCGKVWECKDDLLETLESILQKRLHFETVDHQLKVYGYCEECQKKRAAEAAAEKARHENEE
ncbi:MAG: transcriptional repressor [Megasphaera sp.]|jgi:Fur family ferric uptake transcriptional regulator|nr:transcriptional repressor [Megasphaera sp.]MCH4187266.1 transcriptional repressor [Megasphaera sp.]MCH4217232.1 transcriptional repressor [Megasphaera sp.]